MGLAASQARFLGITARKSNIEYEGQQVNQQRTALAEEVNSLYTQLLSLSVPTAPDTTDYYETNYSFSIDNTEDYDGDYIIKSYYQNDDGTYYLNTERTYTKNVASGTVLQNASITSSTSTDDDGNETKTYTLNTTDASYTLAEAANSSSMISLINSTYGDGTISTDDSMYYYQDSEGITHYISASAVQNYKEGNSLSSYISTNSEVTESVVFSNADITFDSNNRFSSISATDPATGSTLISGAEVSTTRTYDSDGYDAALRDYTMSKDEYDKKVADLNAQTETLQNEDKILELRLDQVDTEQNELQTELEAVKAVLDKNIENTFNTFS
ncbi:MAG: hypothetical protein LUH05_06790 [Candidatus Gastranaerophilales bacterium]|nr:hypothetical protein [Candidatus Gastranaerophilales bacterium]